MVFSHNQFVLNIVKPYCNIPRTKNYHCEPGMIR